MTTTFAAGFSMALATVFLATGLAVTFAGALALVAGAVFGFGADALVTVFFGALAFTGVLATGLAVGLDVLTAGFLAAGLAATLGAVFLMGLATGLGAAFLAGTTLTGVFLATGFAVDLATGLLALLTLVTGFLAGVALATGLAVFLAAVFGLVAISASVTSLRRDD
ncbi:MAG: hypothetical protein ACOYBR_00580 [Fluviibacter sp.]